VKTVVVGIDGTEAAAAALEVAADEARRRAARLVVVHAWRIPSAAFPMSPATYLPDASLYEEAAKAVVDRALQGIDTATVPHGVTKAVVRAAVPDAILELAGDAELVVLGSRRRGALGQLLLGSVGQAVVKASNVPVLIVPEAVAVAAA
jgi:nucleotide-binding universal stress UspA family protein